MIWPSWKTPPPHCCCWAVAVGGGYKNIAETQLFYSHCYCKSAAAAGNPSPCYRQTPTCTATPRWGTPAHYCCYIQPALPLFKMGYPHSTTEPTPPCFCQSPPLPLPLLLPGAGVGRHRASLRSVSAHEKRLVLGHSLLHLYGGGGYQSCRFSLASFGRQNASCGFPAPSVRHRPSRDETIKPPVDTNQSPPMIVTPPSTTATRQRSNNFLCGPLLYTKVLNGTEVACRTNTTTNEYATSLNLE